MKYLLILIPIIAQAKETQPKFYKDEAVKYKVSFFYHKVCSGNGIIDDLNTDSDGSYTYTIKTPREEEDCPVGTDIPEKDIKAAE